MTQLVALRKENQRLKQKVEDLQNLMGIDSCTLPVELLLSNFEQRKKDGDVWYSPPFYTHPEGYKMCLLVASGGLNDGAKTHLSLYLVVIKGEYDETLKWPLTGKFTLQLLSQKGDERHFTKMVTFDYTASHEVTGRVVNGERAARCRGYGRFIPHTYLKPAYLQNDCLKFYISRSY